MANHGRCRVKKSRLQRHKRLNPGTKGLKRTEFKSKGSGFQSGTKNERRFKTRGSRRNGPVKARSESTHIPKAIKLAAYARDEWRCQCCGLYIPGSGRRWCLQHRDARGMGGSKLRHTLPNLVLVCGWTVDPGTCTEWMEIKDRPAATRLGWLVPNGVTPEQWRVWRWTPDGHRWEQPGDMWTPAEPHPRQREEVAA